MVVSALIGAGASLIGGLMGASAEKKAAKQNYEIAMANLGWDKEKFNKMLEIALRQEQEGKLGQTDAEGTQYHFVEGKGWVVDLSEVAQLRKAVYDAEETRKMAQDVPLRRERMFENVAGQREEGLVANQLLQQFRNARRADPNGTTALRNKSAADAYAAAINPAMEAGTRDAFRTGNAEAAGDIARKLGVGQMDALRRAFLENSAGARQESNAGYEAERTGLANLYNMFKTRSTAMPNVDVTPPNLTGQQAQGLQSAAGAGQQASANNLNANQQPTPQLKYTAPVQYGMANTFARLGETIGTGQFDNIFGGSSGGGGSGNIFGSGFPSAPAGSLDKDRYEPWA